MQDRYAGDVGDYIKLGLLRTLAAGKQLGVAWFLHPDEAHNADGKHVSYLSEPVRWRYLDSELFDGLRNLATATRSVAELERADLLDATFHRECTMSANRALVSHEDYRTGWFERLREALRACDIIFADPDNGLVSDAPERIRHRKYAKQISLREAIALADGRPAVIYHHNTRFKGGHDQEVDFWLSQLGPHTMAIRATAFSCRTFFILNPDRQVQERAEAFCTRWSKAKVRLHVGAVIDPPSPGRLTRTW
jgi:hypothetical protein